MLGRGRREERRDERQTFGARGNATRYQMREKLLSIGDDSWIEDESGRRAFKVDGKALRLRKTLVIEDPQGNELAKIQDRLVHVRDVMEIEGPDGSSIAKVKKAMITPLRERFSIDLATGAELSAHGNIVDHEFEIEADGTKVAEVSKKWFRVAGQLRRRGGAGQNDALILAVTVCIDQMTLALTIARAAPWCLHHHGHDRHYCHHQHHHLKGTQDMGTNNIDSFWDVLLWSFWIFIWISAIIIWFRCVFDLFSDRTLSGWGKAGWAIAADLRAVARCADLPHRARPQHGRAPDGGHGRRAGAAGEVHQAGRRLLGQPGGADHARQVAARLRRHHAGRVRLPSRPRPSPDLTHRDERGRSHTAPPPLACPRRGHAAVVLRANTDRVGECARRRCGVRVTDKQHPI